MVLGLVRSPCWRRVWDSNPRRFPSCAFKAHALGHYANPPRRQPPGGTAASAHHPTPMHPRPSRRRPLPPVTSGNQGAAQARTSLLQDGRCAAPTARSRPRAASDLTGAPWVAGQVWTCGCGCSGPDGSVPTAAGRRRRPRPSSTRCRRSRCRGAHPPGAGGLEPPPPRRRCAEPPGPRRCGGSRHWP